MSRKFILILIFILSLVVRVYKTGQYPSLLWDEAALGYNAYSILKTGKDEYGKTLPIIFKSFGDYKPGLYVYLTVPFIALFGLTPFAVRLPSVLIGACMPLVLYWVIKEFFNKEKLAIMSALALSLMPWHIHFSKGAWESNVMVGLILLAVYFLQKGISLKKHWLIILSLLFCLLSLMTYQGAKMITPLVMISLLLVNLKFLTNGFKEFIDSLNLCKLITYLGLIGAIIIWYLVSFCGPAKNRLATVSVFSYTPSESQIKQVLSQDSLETKNVHYQLFHGVWLHHLRGVFHRFFNHFSPRYLAFSGDWQSNRHSAPYYGMIGYLGFGLFVLGLIKFLKTKQNRFFLIWLVLAPLPAALSRDMVSGVRSLTMVIPLAFFIGNGLAWLTNLSIGRRFKMFVFMGISFVFIIEIGYYLDLYYNHLVKHAPSHWLYGYQEAVSFIEDSSRKDAVYMTNFYGQPYIFYLFYTKYPPMNYQSMANLDLNSVDVGTVTKLDNIRFRPVSWLDVETRESGLFIFSKEEIIRSQINKKPELFKKFKPLGEINNQAMFYAYEK